MSSATASSSVWPTTLGIVTSGLPEETSIVTTVSLSTRVPSVGVLVEDDAFLDVRVGHADAPAGRAPSSSIFLTASACWMPDDVRDGDRLGALRAGPGSSRRRTSRATSSGEHRADREEPRPERPSALRRLVLRRRAAAARSASPRSRRCARSPESTMRRGLRGLGRDASAARDRLEVGVHRRGRLVAVGGLLRERAQDDEVEVVGHVRAQLGRRRRRLREVLHRDLDRAVAGERHLAGEQLEEHDPGRVEVGRLVDRRAARLLGREVLRGADDRALLGHLARARARDAEVRHLDDALGVDDDVVRLDVAVDDAVAVREAQRGEDLARVRDRDRDRGRGRARGSAPSASAPRRTPWRCSRCPRPRRGRRSRRCSGARGRRRASPRGGSARRTARRSRSASCSILIATRRPSSWSSAR